MDQYTDTPEQAALREALRAFLRQHATPERVRQAMADPAGFDETAWKRLTGELGLTALAVPERFDGVGAGLGEVAVAVEEIGRVLLPVPYLSSVLVAAVLGEAAEAGVEAAGEYLGALASGELTAALVLADTLTVADGRLSGTATHVIDAPQADLFLARAGDALYAVRRVHTDVAVADTMDQTRGQAAVSFHGATATLVSRTGDGGALARRSEELLRVLLAVESVGAAEQALAITVEYLKTREQFGRPIGTFQALKHRCADLAVEVAAARATAHAAVQAALGASEDSLDVLGPLAKRYCADVFFHVAAEMIQLHGGIGFTWEHQAHLYLKRAKSTQLLHGTPGELRRLVADRANLG
jgi:alkylation response protein AidB-like acyl-CoA dehydrogenase